MKTFYQWMNESEEVHKDVALHELRVQRKKLNDQLTAVTKNFNRNGWFNLTPEEIEEKYPTHPDAIAYRQLNNQINDINDQIRKLNMQ